MVPEHDNPQVRILRHALRGSATKLALANALGVSVEQLDGYLDGATIMPTEVYLVAIDIVAGVKKVPRE